MKNLTVILLFLVLIGCSKEPLTIPNYKERKLSFSDLRYGYDTSNQWIRIPQNILMVHETFKKIGYKSLLSEESWFIDINKDVNVLIDSLLLTYDKVETSPKYYSEFWKRRIKEKNEKEVLKVLEEVKDIIDGKIVPINNSLINDTLSKLLSFEYPERKLSDIDANQQLNYLLSIRLHESVYNLVSGENSKYYEVNWKENSDKIIQRLDTTKNFIRPWFEDDTK